MRCIAVFLLIILMIATLSACAPIELFPQEGEWYCEELGLRINFTTGTKGHQVFLSINDHSEKCLGWYRKNDKTLFITCQDLKCQYHSAGISFLSLKFISLEGSNLILEDTNTDMLHTFIRVD